MVQNDKKFCLSCFLSQELYIISLSVMLHMCKMIISPGVFFSFSKFWFFGFLGVKGQKTVQNDKKFCQLLFISKGPYIIWLSFLVDICKIIISSGVLFIFPRVSFSGTIGWGQKIVQGEKKLCLLHSISQESSSYDCHLWCECVKL